MKWRWFSIIGLRRSLLSHHGTRYLEQIMGRQAIATLMLPFDTYVTGHNTVNYTFMTRDYV